MERIADQLRSHGLLTDERQRRRLMRRMEVMVLHLNATRGETLGTDQALGNQINTTKPEGKSTSPKDASAKAKTARAKSTRRHLNDPFIPRTFYQGGQFMPGGERAPAGGKWYTPSYAPRSSNPTPEWPVVSTRMRPTTTALCGPAQLTRLSKTSWSYFPSPNHNGSRPHCRQR